MRLLASIRAALMIAASCCGAATDVIPIDAVDEVYPPPIAWDGKRVLHIGDSHVSAGLTAGLRQQLRQGGARYKPIYWIGSRAKTWVVSGRLKRLLRKHGPNVVIVTLGTNAMKNRHTDRHAPWIRSLVRLIGPRRCFWLGPPSLIRDRHRYNEMAESACKPCRYFETRVLGFQRRLDGKFHLTRSQGRHWASQAWSWMNGDWPPLPESNAL
jgi:hypothetical protein